MYCLLLPPRYLVDCGAIKPLCDLLSTPDVRIVTVALEGLENILKVGQFSGTTSTLPVQRYHINTTGSKQVARMVCPACSAAVHGMLLTGAVLGFWFPCLWPSAASAARASSTSTQCVR